MSVRRGGAVVGSTGTPAPHAPGGRVQRMAATPRFGSGGGGGGKRSLEVQEAGGRKRGRQQQPLAELQKEVRALEMQLMRLEFEQEEGLSAEKRRRDEKRAAEAAEVDAFRRSKDRDIEGVMLELHGEREAINRRVLVEQEGREFLLATGEASTSRLRNAAASYEAQDRAEAALRDRKLAEQTRLQAEIEEGGVVTRSLEAEKKVIEAEVARLEGEKGAHEAAAAGWVCQSEAARVAIAEVDRSLSLHEEERRKLHNRLEELKGNIRVMCRIRAPLDTSRDMIEYVVGEGGKNLKLRGKERAGLAGDGSKADDFTFKYDYVFGPSSTQEEVFKEVSPMVQSCLDGFKVCIFAYGQTGSGKTYTMEGLPDKRGVIPRAVRMVFDEVSRLRHERGFTCDLSCSFLEIYNDELRDLLGKRAVPLKLVGTENDTRVDGLSEYRVDNQATVEELLSAAQSKRACAATKMNDQSSRSHSVFMLRIKTQNPVTNVTLHGLLNLIDLAGSEKVNASEVQGQRFKEAVAINSSLSHLGDVIHSLGQGGSYVNYRNCTLTRLLKPSLGGSSKCLMLVNTSPFKEHVEESLKSLKFAQRVNSTKIGVAKRSLN